MNSDTALRLLLAGLVVCFGLTAARPVAADPLTQPVGSFSKAKKIARDTVYADNRVTLYCGCSYVPTGRSGGRIDSSECGYEPRMNATRGSRLEWEHIMPAWFFGHTRSCWTDGHPECVNSRGKPFKGRRCCARVDEKFKQVEADLHNLAPSVGELNGDRSNLPYGEVEREAGEYGDCDFKIDRTRGVVEPMDSVKGDVARVWLYMNDAYQVELAPEQQGMFREWSETDPVDDWERERDQRVEKVQGNSNPFVRRGRHR